MGSVEARITKDKLNLKNLEATEIEFLQNVMQKVRLFQNFWKQRLIIWMTTLALKFNFWYSKMKNMIGGIATTHLVLQKLFTVHKEKHLHTEDELDVFLTNCKS